MNIRFATIAGLCAGLAGSAFAADSEGQFVVRGLGGRSCASLNEALKGENGKLVALRLTDWVSGWLSHANRVTDSTYDVHPVSEAGAISEIVRRICVANTEASIETVLHSSVQSVKRGAQTANSAMITIKIDDKQTRIRGAIMKPLQERLVDLKYLEKKQADGVYGPATRKALEAFQSDSKIAVTGLPDPITVYLAFLE